MYVYKKEEKKNNCKFSHNKSEECTLSNIRFEKKFFALLAAT